MEHHNLKIPLVNNLNNHKVQAYLEEVVDSSKEPLNLNNQHHLVLEVLVYLEEANLNNNWDNNQFKVDKHQDFLVANKVNKVD